MSDWQQGDYSGDFEFDISEFDEKLAEKEPGSSAEVPAKEAADQKRDRAADDKSASSNQAETDFKKRGDKKKSGFDFDPAAVRQGIIMKEILSPPRAKSPHPVFKRRGKKLF